VLDSKWTTTLLIVLIIGIVASFYVDESMLGLKKGGDKSTTKPPISNSDTARKVEPWVRVTVTPFAEGFELPTDITNADDGSNRLFIAEKPGRIKIAYNGEVLNEPFLDITDKVRSKEAERGLLGVAFHPGYKENGRFFVNYTDLNGDTVVSEYKVSADPNRADPESEQILLQIDQPASNHNGGQIQFGPDGYLYIGTGDGGSTGDPWGNAQNKNTLLGKILRIDVDGGKPYGIPPDNPFINDPNAKDEIWAYGLRNPWRFSFDAKSGDMFIADVGEGKWEEVNFQPRGSGGGENYGWNLFEENHKFSDSDELDITVFPVFDYSHDEGCSITGGYVYRGNKYPELAGTYLFSDFCSGKIWGLRNKGDVGWEWTEFLDTELGVSSFGVDENNGIYLLNLYDGSVHLISTVPQE